MATFSETSTRTARISPLKQCLDLIDRFIVALDQLAVLVSTNEDETFVERLKNESATGLDLKKSIARRKGTPVDQLVLFVNGMKLPNKEPVLPQVGGCKCVTMITLNDGMGGAFVSNSKRKLKLEPDMDVDYTTLEDDGQPHFQGGIQHTLPYGCKAYGIQRPMSVPWDDGDNYVITYTVVHCCELATDVRQGYVPQDITVSKKSYRGIVSTPDFEFAALKMARRFQFQESGYVFVLMNRANAASIDRIETEDGTLLIHSSSKDIYPVSVIVRLIGSPSSSNSCTSCY